MVGLIGHTGLIGKFLANNINIDCCYNSQNITQASGQTFDILYCCAPSSNRIIANRNPDQDLDNINQIIAVLKSVVAKQIIMISTVDTQHDPDSPYGANRLKLEQFIKSMPNYHIVRLCSLIDPNISKNVLYDLKHKTFLDSINLAQVMHWYRLQDLPKHLDIIVSNQLKEINLVSEPIQNQDIVNRFFSDLNLSNRKDSPAYDLVCNQLPGVNKYVYTKAQIFEFMQEYLDD